MDIKTFESICVWRLCGIRNYEYWSDIRVLVTW